MLSGASAILLRTCPLTWAPAFPNEVDWDLDILDHMVPGIKSLDANYTEKDYEEQSEGKMSSNNARKITSEDLVSYVGFRRPWESAIPP